MLRDGKNKQGARTQDSSHKARESRDLCEIARELCVKRVPELCVGGGALVLTGASANSTFQSKHQLKAAS